MYGDRRQRVPGVRDRVHRDRQRLLQINRTQHRGRSSPALDPLHGLAVQKQLEKRDTRVLLDTVTFAVRIVRGRADTRTRATVTCAVCDGVENVDHGR